MSDITSTTSIGVDVDIYSAPWQVSATKIQFHDCRGHLALQPCATDACLIKELIKVYYFLNLLTCAYLSSWSGAAGTTCFKFRYQARTLFSYSGSSHHARTLVHRLLSPINLQVFKPTTRSMLLRPRLCWWCLSRSLVAAVFLASASLVVGCLPPCRSSHVTELGL